MRLVIFYLFFGLGFASREDAPPFVEWLARFGHDDFTLPQFMLDAIADCDCYANPDPAQRPICRSAASGAVVSWRDAVARANAATDEESNAGEDKLPSPGPASAGLGASAAQAANALGYCVAKAWLLEHMPAFDLTYLPPAVSVNGTSMLDDVAAFAALADLLQQSSSAQRSSNSNSERKSKSSGWAVPLAVKLEYVLPYAAYHEARSNWRPLLFAKLVNFTWGTQGTAAAMAALVAPNVFAQWASSSWPSDPKPPATDTETDGWELVWGSSSAPPVVAPFEMVAYGYGSCTGWATLLTYALRSVGVPARQVGTPCWNGGAFKGLARDNANVSLCWAGGDGRTQGGGWLYNHNWVEFWDDVTREWAFVNVPPTTSVPNAGLSGCPAFSVVHGCGFEPAANGSSSGGGCDAAWANGPGAAMADHEILAATWALPLAVPSVTADYDGATAAAPPTHMSVHGGPVVDAAGWTLSDGHPASPLVWAPQLQSPLGLPLQATGLRFVNRTGAYRCKE